MLAQYKRGGGVLFLMMAFLLTVSGANLAETPTTIQNFVVLGQEGVWIKQGGTIASGDIGANTASAGPFLSDGAEVVVGLDVKMLDPTTQVMGDSLRVRQGAQVYNVSYNDLSGLGQILGAHVSPVNLPLVQTFPPVPGFTPGTQNLTVPINGTLRLNAGSYGTLLARAGSTVTFTGGIYNFQAWDIRSTVKLYFEAPAEIRIAGRLDTDLNSYVGPSPMAAGINASDISIIVTGMNGSTGALDATPKAAEFGIQNIIAATVYTPNGTLWIKEGGVASGAFLGRWVIIGEEVRVTHTGATDHDPPTVTASISPPPNGAGWHHENVTITFACSDAGSGIAQCPGPVVVSQEGVGQVITGTATDRAGNNASVSVSLNVDTTPPSVSIISPLDGSMRNISPVTITGTSLEALSGISSIVCGATPAALSGSNFTCQLPLTEGANQVVVQATDSAGNMGSSTVTAILDTTPPVVTIASPENGTRVKTNSLTISGHVNDPSATVTVNSFPAPVAPDGTWTVDIQLHEGENILSVVAADIAGNRWQGSVTVFLETIQPLTLCAKPYQSDIPAPPVEECAAQALASYIGFGSTVGLVVGLVDQRATSLTLNGVELPDGEEVVETGAISDGMREGAFFWAYVTIPKTPGSYAVTAVATDAAGAQQSATASFSPALIFCAEPFQEQIPSEPTEACASQAFARTIGFVAGLIDESEVSVAINDVELPDGVEINNTGDIRQGMREGTFFWAFVNMPSVDGLHPFTAVATNAQGNERRTTVTFLRDTTPPHLTITAPPNGSYLNATTVTIVGSVDDPGAIVRQSFFGQVIPVNNGAFQITVNLPREGTNLIPISATDSFGNLSSVTTLIIRDTVPPAVTIMAPQPGSVINTPVIAIQGIIVDQNPVTATMTVNTKPPQSLALTAGAYSNSVTLSEGANQILIQAIDAAGNIGTAAGNILLDVTPPSVHVTAPAAGAQLSGIVAVTADVSDLLSGIQRVDLLANGATIASRSTPPYSFSLNTALLPAGDTALTVHAIDRAGNVTDVATAVSILGGQIALQITSPAAGDTITQSPILVRGTLKKNSLEPITEEVGITVNGVLAQFQGTEFGVEGIPLEPGTQAITAIATGSERLSTTTSTEITFVPGEIDLLPILLHASPSSALAPVEVTFTTEARVPDLIISYQVDFEGDGVIDQTSSILTDTTHVYLLPGLYLPTLIVTDVNGNHYQTTTVVNILDRIALNNLLQHKWNGVKTALANQDVEEAVSFIAGDAKEMYRQNFTLMHDFLPQIVSGMGPIQLVKSIENVAIYEMIAVQDYQSYSFYVEFDLDADGLWKMRFF